jgi:hypothetical protein
MKFNLAIAALLGLLSVQAVTLEKHHHKNQQNVQIRPDPIM